MVFSLFRRDKRPRAEPARTPSPRPADEARVAQATPGAAPAGQAAAPDALSPGAPAAAAVRQAAAASRTGASGQQAAAAASVPSAPRPVAAVTPQQVDAPVDDPGPGGLEIGSTGVASVIEQAAILYANDQADSAAEVLGQAIRAEQPGCATPQAWLMLMDLYQFLGRQEAFETLAIDFAARFERSPPTWRDADVVRAAAGERSAGRAAVVLPAVIDAGVARQIEAIDRAAQRDRDLSIDCRGVRALDAAGAGLLDAALDALERGTQQVTLTAPDRLLAAAQAAVQAGRRDDDPGAWRLLLRMLRLVGTQQQFEDASIDYCVTYEVSPPSWEPMPARFRSDEAGVAGASAEPPAPVGSAGLAVVADAPPPRADAYVLAGDLLGAAEPEMAGLLAHAERHAHVFVDCRRLRRVDFAAAGQLLNAVASLRGAGRTVEFDQPNHAVAALLTVMGLPEMATITPRRP